MILNGRLIVRHPDEASAMACRDNLFLDPNGLEKPGGSDSFLFGIENLFIGGDSVSPPITIGVLRN